MRITLIGSARFLPSFHQWNEALTKRGHAVYSLGVNRQVEDDVQKKVLDAVHLTKIQNSDAIVLINQDDYIGESTMGELLFAMLTGKQLLCTQKPRTRSWGIGFCSITPALTLLDPDALWDHWILTEDKSTVDMDQASSDQPFPGLLPTSTPVESTYPQDDLGPPGCKYSSVSKY